MAHDNHASAHANTLPADLGAPAFVNAWKRRALVICLIALFVAATLALAGSMQGDIYAWEHVLRAWLLGLMITFGFAVGGMALLMVQYLSGGKWGLLVRRPLEAMSRTLPLTFLYFLPVAIFGVSFGKLYLWAQYPTVASAVNAAKSHAISNEQAHAIIFKKGMLNPTSFWGASVFCFA